MKSRVNFIDFSPRLPLQLRKLGYLPLLRATPAVLWIAWAMQAIGGTQAISPAL